MCRHTNEPEIHRVTKNRAEKGFLLQNIEDTGDFSVVGIGDNVSAYLKQSSLSHYY